MMIKKRALLIIFIVYFGQQNLLWAKKNPNTNLVLNVAALNGITFLRTAEKMAQPAFGFGFSTHLGYFWKGLEFSVNSYMNMSRVSDTLLFIRDSEIKGSINLRSVSFSPVVKYNFIFGEAFINKFYFLLGPSMALITVKPIDVVITGGSYDRNNKLTYESYGFTAGFGIKDIMFQESYPVFLEVTYKLLVADEVAEVGGTTLEVKVVSEEGIRHTFREQTLMLNIGMELF